MTLEKYTGETTCQFIEGDSCRRYVRLRTQLKHEAAVEEADSYISGVCKRGGYGCEIKKGLETKDGS